MKVLQWPAPHVKENLGHWGRVGHEREINKATALALGRNAKRLSSRSSRDIGDITAGSAVETRRCISVVC
jgi:hypothetical protein